MIVPVILCGGSGTRLWPLSRQKQPKQFLPLINEYTLLQNTIRRLEDFEPMADPVVLCHESHRFIVAEQLRQIGCRPAAIILEPVGRNTAPAVTVAALHALKQGKNPILLVLPADHHINDIKRLHTALAAGAQLAKKGHLITFGIVPTSAETGYGYIHKGEPIVVSTQMEAPAFLIAQFVEKPDHDTARGYVKSGEYCWNSGIFVFAADQVLAEMEKSAPEIAAVCRRAYSQGHREHDFFRLDEKTFSACPSDSIDYAVMEHTNNGAMIALEAGWSDLGSWRSLWQEGIKDTDGNVISGDIIVQDVNDSYLHASHRLLAAVGLDRHIVVETSDAVFVAPRNRVQDVKEIVEQLQSARRREARSHPRAYRPWGWSEAILEGDQFQVKQITLKPGAKISLQKHIHRAEHWILVRGTAKVVKGEEKFTLEQNESTYIPPGVYHQLENPGQNPLDLIEIRTNRHLLEDDLTRSENTHTG
jgi:mannose-1-phosphate guanylyltransferase/mannose-6-phosphate isomerase